MISQIIKNVIAISWIGAVIFFYLKHNDYVTNSLTSIWDYWTVYLIIMISSGGMYLLYKWFTTQKKTFKLVITFPKIVIGILLMILISGNAVFIANSPSYYEGSNLFYVPNEDIGGGYIHEIDDLSTLTGNETLVVGDGTAFQGTAWGLDMIVPQQFHNRFQTPTFWQIQTGLMQKSIGLLLILSLITLTATSVGFTLISLFFKDYKKDEDNTFIAFGTGLLAIITTCFMLAALSFLNVWTAWGAFVLLIGIFHKNFIEIIKKILKLRIELESKYLSLTNLVLFILGIVITANFIDNISATPRGWDGMNQYVNIANQISETGGLIQTGSTYYWEILTSLGLTMFDWMTATLQLHSFFPALVCLIGLYIVIKKFTKKQTALIVASVLYLSPMFEFHGVEENKVDLGNLAISIIAFLSIYKGAKAETKKEKLGYFALGGLMAGFTLGIKLTSLLLIFALLVFILHHKFGKTGLVSGLILGTGAFALANSINIGTATEIASSVQTATGVTLILISIAILGVKIFKEKGHKALIYPLVFIIFAVAAFSPWAIKNVIETGELNSRSILSGLNAQPKINHEYLETQYDINPSACITTGTHEELDRYIGYDSVLKNYLTMPWDLTIHDSGVSGTYVDFGWIPLALIPALILFIGFKKPDEKWCLAIGFGLAYWLFWGMTSNGIIWYGLPGLIPVLIILGGLLDNYDNKTKLKYIGVITLSIFLLTSLTFRLQMFGKSSLLLYASNTITEEQAEAAIFPFGNDVREALEQDTGLIWKIGTALSYFIEDNFERTFNDQYMDDFTCIYQDQNPELMTKMLQDLGFQYIIFDQYTYTLSPDPEGTLWNKYMITQDYIYNYTDPVIIDYFNGRHLFKLRN